MPFPSAGSRAGTLPQLRPDGMRNFRTPIELLRPISNAFPKITTMDRQEIPHQRVHPLGMMPPVLTSSSRANTVNHSSSSNRVCGNVPGRDLSSYSRPPHAIPYSRTCTCQNRSQRVCCSKSSPRIQASSQGEFHVPGRSHSTRGRHGSI